MSRKKGILAAGSMTGFILLAILALGFRNISANGGEGQNAVFTESAPLTLQQPEPGTDAETASQAWQTYSRQLEDVVQTMQQREADYQAQLEQANQTILQLQEQLNNANVGSAYQINPATAAGDDDDGAYEYAEHEHEGHEYDD